MTDAFVVNAELRADQGKGASRRLRHQGKVPAVLYGGKRRPVCLTLDHDEILHKSQQEGFYSSIIEIKVADGRSQQVVVRDLQRHPFRQRIMHLDFLRVTADHKLRISVPLHFIGEAQSPAGKTSGVVIQHQVTEVEITALPKDLPEYIEVDLSQMEVGDTVMLADIILPEGVEIPTLAVRDENNVPVANAAHVREIVEVDEAAVAAADEEAEADEEDREAKSDEDEESGKAED